MSLSTVPKGSVLALIARVARDSMARRPSRRVPRSPRRSRRGSLSCYSFEPALSLQVGGAGSGESLVAVKKIQFFHVNRCMLALATCHRPPQPHPDPAQHHRSL